MSLNIKDAYRQVIEEHLLGNKIGEPSQKYLALPLFKEILDEYAKEKLEAFIDDHFPEDSNRKWGTIEIPLSRKESNLSTYEKMLFAKSYQELSDAISAARKEATKDVEEIKEHCENNKMPGVPDIFNSLYYGAGEALNNFRKFSAEQEKSSDLGKSGGRQGTQEQWDNVNKDQEKITYIDIINLYRSLLINLKSEK
jgi:hypothetical protein